jgi:hypothetical protein
MQRKGNCYMLFIEMQITTIAIMENNMEALQKKTRNRTIVQSSDLTTGYTRKGI